MPVGHDVICMQFENQLKGQRQECERGCYLVIREVEKEGKTKCTHSNTDIYNRLTIYPNRYVRNLSS